MKIVVVSLLLFILLSVSFTHALTASSPGNIVNDKKQLGSNPGGGQTTEPASSLCIPETQDDGSNQEDPTGSQPNENNGNDNNEESQPIDIDQEQPTSPDDVQVIHEKIPYSASPVQPTEENITYYKQTLDLPESAQVKNESVTKLIERKNEDYDNFVKITDTSKTLTEPDDRETFVNELVDMNQEFTNEFAESVLESEEKSIIKEQVDDYIFTIKNEDEITVQIDDLIIEALFNEYINIDDFIEKVWG